MTGVTKHVQSCHYLSTPVLYGGPGWGDNKLGEETGGENCMASAGDIAGDRDNTASLSAWVANTARFTRCFSYSDLSSGSSDRTDSANSSLLTSSSKTIANRVNTALSPKEVSLIRSTFSSYKTICYISSRHVTLYSSTSSSPWSLVYPVPLVPTLVLNLGGSRARQVRGVELVLAERGTGLAMWRDKMDSLSCYKGNTLLHTMYYSRDHRVRIGLNWDRDSQEVANMFTDWVQDLMDRPENVGLSGPKKRLYKNKKCQKKNEENRQVRYIKSLLVQTQCFPFSGGQEQNCSHAGAAVDVWKGKNTEDDSHRGTMWV